jgi:GTPase SAR1 family protein
MKFITNPQIELAFNYVRNTGKNIFLTGKAGSGKTTFLHQLKAEGLKHMIVVAPTGVAAINAGGMTIHSFFQLPFGPIVPGRSREDHQKRKFSGTKIAIIRTLDLLVIDEISMVRADVLDGIDEVLRRYKDYTKPFGGIQLLMIGDLHQLPPVVKQDEWEILRPYYQTPYFFGSNALQKTDPVTIELKHIYRQSDSTFIDLLNRVRDNRIDAEVLEILNSRYRADFQPTEEEAYITLTAHNAAAQQINAEKLALLDTEKYRFKAKITGEFPALSFPNDEILEFKVGAQVMFNKNDISQDKLFYNGKIGQITGIDEDKIFVRCPGENSDITVGQAEWHNVKYSINEQTKEVREDTVGSFVQYPLKLAWAITIHKSQGLTFERAIIDAQAAFAHGQVYVALSRCKSFEGIVLRSKIEWTSIKTDSVVRQYSEEAERNAPDENHLALSKREYQQAMIRELFSFRSVRRPVEQLQRHFLEHENTYTSDTIEAFITLATKIETTVFDITDKFLPQLHSYFQQPESLEENALLQERLQKAANYFYTKLSEEMLPESRQIPFISDNKGVVKTGLEYLENLQKEIFVKIACFKTCTTTFSTASYINARTHAEFDFANAKRSAPTAAPTSAAPRNTTYPELYKKLAQWRESVAFDHGVEPYEVLPTKTLQDLVLFLPVDTASLKKIKGIGKVRIKQFGEEITDIIRKFCAEEKIPVKVREVPELVEELPKIPKPDSKSISLAMFEAGKTIEEISQERGYVPSTIGSHLAHFIGLGQLDIHQVMDKEKTAEILAYFIDKKTKSRTEAKAHFGDRYSYTELNMVLSHLGWLVANGELVDWGEGEVL